MANILDQVSMNKQVNLFKTSVTPFLCGLYGKSPTKAYNIVSIFFFLLLFLLNQTDLHTYRPVVLNLSGLTDHFGKAKVSIDKLLLYSTPEFLEGIGREGILMKFQQSIELIIDS